MLFLTESTEDAEAEELRILPAPQMAPLAGAPTPCLLCVLDGWWLTR
jgi:hypothetical protein